MNQAEKSLCVLPPDGLTELLVGVLLMMAGINIIQPVSFPAYVVLIIFLVPFLQKIKGRFSDSRLNYNEVQNDDPKETVRSIVLFILLILSVAILGFIFFGNSTENAFYRQWAPAFIGILMFGAFHSAAGSKNIFRYRVLSILAPLSGVAFSLMSSGYGYKDIGYFLFFFSGIILSMGLVLFLKFIRKYPSVKKTCGPVK